MIVANADQISLLQKKIASILNNLNSLTSFKGSAYGSEFYNWCKLSVEYIEETLNLLAGQVHVKVYEALDNFTSALISQIDNASTALETNTLTIEVLSKKFNSYSNEIRNQLITYQFQLRAWENFGQLNRLSEIVSQSNISEIEAKVKSSQKELESLMSQINDRSIKQLAKEQGEFFNEEGTLHKDISERWLTAGVVSLCVLVAFIGWIGWHSYRTTMLEFHLTYVSQILWSVLCISILSVVLKICFGRYLSSRRLAIIYFHRSNLVSKYSLFETGLDDPTTRSAMKLELAKYMFTDPAIDFESNTGSELNVNPVISLTEKFLESKRN